MQQAMGYFNLLLILACVVSSFAEFADDMQVYEQSCLGEDKIHCADGDCVWKHQYCDGKVDCQDGSDENLCEDHTPKPELCNPESHFLCKDHSKCIPNTWLCNNDTDCKDGSDEANCTIASESTDAPEPAANVTCKGFMCKTEDRCISRLWACDGVYDCPDLSDEDSDTCHHFGYARHAREKICEIMGFHGGHIRTYECLDDSMCIQSSYMCDGMMDCKDGSDEGTFCEKWKEMCVNNNCTSEATCFPDRDGRMCMCNENYWVYNETSRACQPANYCADARPQCPQICENRNGSYFCHCEEGYKSDRLGIMDTCVAPDPEPLLFFSTRNEIKYISTRSRHVVTVASGIKQAHGVTYDGTNVYWVETANGHQAIMRADLRNITATTTILVGLGLEDPGDISIDWKGGNFYFSDAQRGTIAACELNGRMCVTIKTDSRIPKHLTLDVKNNKMYWADWHNKPVIMSAHMDGTEASVLVSNLTSYPTGLTVDSPSGRIYFVDKILKGARLDDGRVFSVNDRKQLFHEPYAIAVFENIIYWSDWASNTIQSWNKVNWRNLGPMVTMDSPIYGLHMYHPIVTPTLPAAESPAHHVRLTGANGSYPACPDGMELDDNNRCTPIKGYRPGYIVVGVGSTFTLVQYNALGGHDSKPVHFTIGRVQAMAYDSLRDVLYMYDADWKTISYIAMSDFYTGSPKSLLFMGLDDVVDMDYDYVTDNLYFADAGRKFIEVVSLKTGKRAIIHRFEQETPISLCVLPDYGKMLVAVSESEEDDVIHIDSFGLDGSARAHLLMNSVRGPLVRLKYSQKMDNVYLSDEGNNVIEHMHPLGTARENYRSLSTSVTELEVTDTLVLWTTRRSHRLYWADIHDTSRNIRRAELLMFPNTTHLHIQATWQHPANVSRHPCHNEPCSDVCVQTPTEWRHPLSSEHTEPGFKCLCPPGLMNMDGRCSELVICTEEEAFCHNSNVCIQKSAVCDGNKDCQHGEDEEACPSLTPKCAEDEKLCEDMCIHKNTQCILPTTTAHTPITTISALEACSTAQFQCSDASSTLCVARWQMCDGVPDCPDGADEARHLCETLNCFNTEFMCSSGNCIFKSFRCDGDIDCNDGSDEFDCKKYTCPVGEFQCRNLECIEMTNRCDSVPDCSDGSDEDHCKEIDFDTDSHSTTEDPDMKKCPDWEYMCELNRTMCLPLTTRCNGKVDCPGATDEARCYDLCADGGLKCRQENRCVPRSQICDGHAECVDGEDEVQESCERVNRTSKLYPVHGFFPREECHDGFYCNNGQCIEWRNVCDHLLDCVDGSDESRQCRSACVNNTCSYSCQPTPLGPLCRCSAGYTLGSDLATCEDLDECALNLCSQHCFNTPGSFVCSCHRGYTLRSDRRTCKAIKGDLSFICVTGNLVRNIRLDGEFSIDYRDSDTTVITDMAYDVLRNNLYVTDAAAGRLAVTNNTHKKIDVTNIGRPTKVVVDWITGDVYFADLTAASPRLRVCHVLRQRCALLQKLPLHSNVSALTIDPASRKLFYCVTRDLESVIWSSTLAGHHVTQLAVVGYCTGLTADSFKKQLYVAETGPARLYAIDYEGNMIKDILTIDRHLQAPRDLTIFEDHIYYLDANSLKLSRCQTYGKKHCEVYFQKLTAINSFLISHESTQRDDLPDFCEKTQCSNVCVQGDLTGICLCDDGSVSKDGSCPLPSKQELPLFNGWVVRDYQRAHVSVIVIAILSALFAIYLAGFLYYHFVYKKRQQENLEYSPVHYSSSTAGSSQGFGELSPITPPTVQMPVAGGSNNEFVNPIQFFRNWKPFKRNTRPIGTAGLQIDVPSLDVSDTESDLDEREIKRIVKP